MSALGQVVRRQVELLDQGMHQVPAVLAALKEAGAVAGQHVSDGSNAPKLTPEQVVEWYAGQLVDILEKKSWFAVNSIICAVDKFCPAEEP